VSKESKEERVSTVNIYEVQDKCYPLADTGTQVFANDHLQVNVAANNHNKIKSTINTMQRDSNFKEVPARYFSNKDMLKTPKMRTLSLVQTQITLAKTGNIGSIMSDDFISNLKTIDQMLNKRIKRVRFIEKVKTSLGCSCFKPHRTIN
jgi:hypothetical protein